jgi:(heptosyl)LPS beta-1,4-glucosyltransferase
MRLTAIVLTRNEANNLITCIETLRFADAIIVFDSHSTDQTPRLAVDAGVRVVQRVFDDYPSQRNAALDLIGEGWVLFVDADERITRDLAEEIREAIELPSYSGFRIPRHNYIFGKRTMGAGWYPDYQTRLLKVGEARYDPSRKVHEVVILDRELGTLRTPIEHFNYRNPTQFREKQERYTAYEAQILFENGIRPKPQNYVLQPVRQFWWRFVTLRGFRDGFHGLRLSALMAWYEWRKYRVLRQLWLEADFLRSGGMSKPS